jgi:Coenzyme PQQ synthesis protein D (PqqD)
MRLRREGLTWRRLGEDIMVLDLESSTYFAVGGTGAFLFETLHDQDLDEPELVEAVLGQYDVDVVTVRSDVSRFLSRMRDAGLLQP